MLRDADEGTDTVKEIEEEKNENDRDGTELQGPDDIELESNWGNRWRSTHQSVKSDDAKDEAEKRAGQDSSQDGAARTAYEKNASHDDTRSGHPHCRVMQIAERDERRRIGRKKSAPFQPH